MLFWGWLWGPAGALLSVPILAATKIVLENIPDLAWISELVDPRLQHHESAEAVRKHANDIVGLGFGAPAGSYGSPGSGSPRSTLPGFLLRPRADKTSSKP
jgi:hypothetical protein